MGRVRVYIPEFGGDPQDDTSWYLANYMSPQGGQTNPYQNTRGGKTEKQSQDAYGSWMTGYHPENEVIVNFLSSNPDSAIIMGSQFQQNMVQSMGGYGFVKSTQGITGPTVEYNKKDDEINPRNPERPIYERLYNQLKKQGILNDVLRTNALTSPHRDLVPQFLSMKTPRGSTFVIDDGKIDPNAGAGINSRQYARQPNGGTSMIRMRTEGGAQTVINDDCGFVQMMSSSGDSWAQMSDNGVAYFTEGHIAIRVEGNMNQRIDGNYNVETLGPTQFNVGGNLNLTTDSGFNLKEQGAGININSEGIYGSKSEGESIQESGGILSYKPAGDIIKKGSVILKNTVSGYSGTPITDFQKGKQNDVSQNSDNSQTSEETETTLPDGGLVTHEPWDGQGQTCGKPDSQSEEELDEETEEEISEGVENGQFEEDVLGVDKDTLNKINNELIKEGYTKEQRAAVLGTFMQESGMRPGVTNGIGAHGLAQWLGPRRNGLNSFAAQNGLNPNSINTQMQFFNHEMGTTESTAGNMLRNSSSFNEAMGAMNRYERFRGWQQGPYGHETGNRYNYGRTFLGYL